MAVLPDGDRAALVREISSDLSASRQVLGLTRAELKAAVDAADSWADSNSTSYNTALPQPARTVLTAKQKAQLLMFVIRRRYEVT